MENRIIYLVSELKRGNMDSFDEFYEMTKRIVFYNIYSLTQNHMMSEDIMQEVYIKFLESLKKIKDESNPMGYLIKVSKNLAIDYLRKSKKEVFLDVYENEEVYGSTEDKIDYSDHMMVDMRKILNENEFKVVIMHVLNDMTHKEIAKTLNKPIGTITWLYNQAIKKLKEGLNYDID